jgi:hypothetical protein
MGMASPFRDFNLANDGGREASVSSAAAAAAIAGDATAIPAVTLLISRNRRREITNPPRLGTESGHYRGIESFDFRSQREERRWRCVPNGEGLGKGGGRRLQQSSVSSYNKVCDSTYKYEVLYNTYTGIRKLSAGNHVGHIQDALFPEAETALASTIDPEAGEPPASAIELHGPKPARARHE